MALFYYLSHDPDFRNLFESVAAEARIRVITFATPAAMMFALSSRTSLPTAILIDLDIPHIDGLEFLNYLYVKEALNNIFFVAVSSGLNPATITKCFASGAQLYLNKVGCIDAMGGSFLKLFKMDIKPR